MSTVASAIMHICKNTESATWINSLVAAETIAMPNPNPVAELAITPKRNVKSTTRPGHRVVKSLSTGRQASLKRKLELPSK